MSNLTGQSIGRYHILEQLGEGGMAIVYKAYDTRLERNVALKVLRTDLFGTAILQQVLQRFEREAKSLAKLSHPNIVNILDYGEHEGNPFLVMEYLPGGTLKQKLGHAIPWQEAIRTLIPIARGLSYAHQHGVIHRDVKPANILINENEEPILTDFGIAKLLEDTEGHTLTVSGVGIGTPEYMAPEQGVGAHSIDARADIYSLGIVLYEMVTGRKPYIADTPMAVVLKQMTDPLPHPTNFVPDLPEDVERVLFKALAKQPEDRYTDMSALIAAMESLLAEPQKREVPTPISPAQKKATPQVKPSFKLVVTVVGVFAVILVILFGAPWVKKWLPTALESEVIPAKVLNVPSATYTVSPSTSTLEPSPSPTPTRTPRPTSTATPVPTWVTEFAKPILAAIKDRPPDFQDDFSKASDYWKLQNGYLGEIEISNGALRVIAEKGQCSAARNPETRLNNSVLLVEADLSGLEGENSAQIRWLQTSYFPNASTILFDLQRDGSWFVSSSVNQKHIDMDSGRQLIGYAEKVTIMLISKGTKYAIYINETPVSYINFSAPHPGDLTLLSAWAGGTTTAIVEYDNLKVWDLDKIPNLP